MGNYKSVLQRSHPYEGVAPQECLSEAMPIMDGHDDTVEWPQDEGSRWRVPMIVNQGPEKTGNQPHDHPGDAVTDSE
jgi:hypothetical protein